METSESEPSSVDEVEIPRQLLSPDQAASLKCRVLKILDLWRAGTYDLLSSMENLADISEPQVPPNEEKDE